MVRYSLEHKQKTADSIVRGAGEAFRREGYGGATIETIARAAGVTNGAFYVHFPGKADAFRAAMAAGLDELHARLEALKASEGEAWLARFIAQSLGPRRRADLGELCALPGLSADAMRADTATRQACQDALDRVIDTVAEGLTALPGDSRVSAAIALMALLSGGVVMARAVADPQVGDQIAAAVETAALDLAGLRGR